MQFKDLGLIEPLRQALDALGHTTPTPSQVKAIPAVLAGRDLIAAAQTGTGKTGSFALPLLQKLGELPPPEPNSISALVLTPTRELAQQVADDLRDYGRRLPVLHMLAAPHAHPHPPGRGSCIRRCRMGRVKPAVLPVPVWAAAIRSRPPSTAGMAWADRKSVV